jgi:hypothetical protein
LNKRQNLKDRRKRQLRPKELGKKRKSQRKSNKKRNQELNRRR